MEDPNITMGEYIRLEEEKTRRHGKVYNWETAMYGRIWYDDDVRDLRSIETKFLAIVFNDKLTSEVVLSCEPIVSSLNENKIDFRISFDESNDEDYTVICDKNSFFYKIISVNDLKTDSENDSDKVNMPSFPSPEPTVSYFDDLDYFKDFEKDFPAIVYDDALTSKLDFVTEPSNNPQKIDEFNLKDETFLSECDEEEQNVLYFNDPFPFNIIYPDDSKSNKDDDDKKIDTEQPSGDIYVIPVPDDINTDVGAYAQGLNMLLKTNMALPPRDQRHQYLEGLEYTDADITDFEDRLGKIYGREIHRGQSVFTSRAWKRLFEIRGSLVHELILEFFSTFRFGEAIRDLDTARALQFQLGRIKRRMSLREFIWGLEMVVVRGGESGGDMMGLEMVVVHGEESGGDMMGLDVGSVNIPYLLARYLRMFALGRKRG
ncbi:hypothetical protein Tco_0779280, partial [Tanacetum coccineum]